MHARLDLDGGGFFMASDWMVPGAPYPGMHGFRVSLSYPTSPKRNGSSTRSRRAARPGAVSEDVLVARIRHADHRFGTPWMVGTEEGEH